MSNSIQIKIFVLNATNGIFFIFNCAIVALCNDERFYFFIAIKVILHFTPSHLFENDVYLNASVELNVAIKRLS